jgi:catechol 2,3-dioxygenase-like lactoylglutathione lyase family enzyme
MRLNHLDLPVANPADTKNFFERHFGFSTIFEREDGLIVMLDDTDFALTLSPIVLNSPREFPTGFHVGFNLSLEAELHCAYTTLTSAGIEIVRPLGMLGGALTFQCLAPGPLLVEVAWRNVSTTE